MDNNRTIGRFMSHKSLIVIALILTLLASSVFSIAYHIIFNGYTSVGDIIKDTHAVPAVIVYIDWIAQAVSIAIHLFCHHSNSHGGNSRLLKIQIWSIIFVDIFYAMFDVVVEYFILKEFSAQEVADMFLIVVSVFSNILIWIPMLKSIDNKEPIDYKMIFIGVGMSLACYAYSVIKWIADVSHGNPYYPFSVFREFALILFLFAALDMYRSNHLGKKTKK